MIVSIACTAILIWMAAQIVRGTWRLTWFAVGLLCYLGIWFFAPRTWREMHDEQR